MRSALAKQILLSIALFVCHGFAGAQSSSSTTSQLDELRAQGYEALYNLDYNTARKYFHEMIQAAPDNPVGAECLATSIWLQQLNEQWELKGSLYSNKSYAEEDDKPDQQPGIDFRGFIRQTKQLSQARLKRDPHDQEALYLLGAAEGLEAAYFAGIERKFMSALRSAQDSVEHHRALLKTAPNFHDAELTIGLYNYVVGDLPLPVKMLVSPMGVKGSKKRGLEMLERVSTEGHRARDLALVLLVDLYKREKRWSDSIKVTRDLVSRYPRNYLFKLQLADGLTHRSLSTSSSAEQDQAEVFKIFESLISNGSKENSPKLYFRYGEALLLLGNSVSATKQFQIVVNSPSALPRLRTLSQLRLAQSLDLAGKRNEALSQYLVVLKSSSNKQVQDEARRGLREPYKQSRD
jgi:tetratricopeptide (TPR) repeat protein